MRDGEWCLTYPGTALTFGPAGSSVVIAGAPDLGDVDIRTDDVDRPRGDGRLFGLDVRTGRTITFELVILGATEAATRATLAEVARVWRADAIRRTPGAVAELWSCYAGRERVTYGRPRRFAATDDGADQGVILAGATFDAVDDLWYGPTEQSVSVGIAPPLGGGLVAPLVAPLTTTADSDRSVAITVGGELPAWPVITVAGPITTPVVEVVGLWRIELATTLAADRSVTIDTRPWARSVLLNGGGSLAGALTRASTRLGDAAIPPGTYEVVLRGIDGTGTASMSIRWRETYTTL